VKFKILALAFSAFCASQAAASSFSAFYTFGDSTVDSGWWKGALNGQCGGGVSSPCDTGNPNFNDKISSAIADGGTGTGVGVGQTMTQDLAKDFGVTSLAANRPGGTNYAISGALSSVYNGAGNLNPNLPSTAGQIANYLGAAPSNLADPSALYLISSGGNDVTNAKRFSATQPTKPIIFPTRRHCWQAPSEISRTPARRRSSSTVFRAQTDCRKTSRRIFLPTLPAWVSNMSPPTSRG
jgi:phospholipase/lecithinase/hemolysin